MSVNIAKIAQDLQQIMSDKDRRKTSPYDTTAEVVNIDGDTLWVHIPGGVDVTPVKRTMNAVPGDIVKVHIENGDAWAIGNSTNPPTDDTRANVAMSQAVTADNKAELALDSIDGLDNRIVAADSRLTIVEGNITTLEGRVDTAETSLTEVEGDITTLEGRVDTAETSLTEVEGDITTLEGRVDTAEGNITAVEGDISTLEGRVDTAEGNISLIDSRVNTAEGNITVIEGNITTINGQITSINSDIDDIESDVSGLTTRVGTAEGKVSTLEGEVSTLDTNVNNLAGRVSTAEGNIAVVESDISALQTDVSTAKVDITTIKGDITTLKEDVSEAQDDIDDALKGLALAENVIGTLAWLTAHSKATTDTTPVSGKSYYIRHQDGTFELVQDTTGKNPSAEGWYEMDDAISNYVGAHLSLTNYGLNLVLDNSSYRLHIGTLTAGGDDGVYIIDGEGHVVSFFGENIEFDSNHAQYIGNENAYIVFDPTGNGGQGSLIIGGSTIQMGSKSLGEILGKTLIYDHTYEYVRDSNNKPIRANFTAFLYRGGVDVKTEYAAENFTWYLKKEEKGTGVISETLIGTGYTCSVNLSDCGYGAEVVGKFTLIDEADALNSDGDNLTDANNDNLSVRATGESVRVRDLTVSTTIFPTDKLMIVGAEDEHLVSIQTLQDYLNANLDKQVLFGTTANWNSQTSLVSDANTLYIYTDHQVDSQGNKVAGIKAGDGKAFVVDLPFTDAIATEHIADTTRHITQTERDFWNNKVRCYYAGTEQLIFTTA